MKFGKLRIASIICATLALIYIPLSSFLLQFAMYHGVMEMLFEILPLIFLLIHLIKFGDASSKKLWFTVALGIKALYYLINLFVGIRGIMVDAVTASTFLVSIIAAFLFGFVAVDSMRDFKFRKASVVVTLIPLLYAVTYILYFAGSGSDGDGYFKIGSVYALLSGLQFLLTQMSILLYLLSLKSAAQANVTTVEPISDDAMEETPTLTVEPMDDEELKKELDKLQWEFETGFIIEPEYLKRKAELLARK